MEKICEECALNYSCDHNTGNDTECKSFKKAVVGSSTIFLESNAKFNVDVTKQLHSSSSMFKKRNDTQKEESFYRVATDITDGIRDMLVAKNKAYGDSALNPVRIFSSSDAVEQINVRIDDKLSRLKRGKEYPGDDTVDDLIGYLVLLKIAKDVEKSQYYYK